jgi:hypothetical protein
MLLLREYSSGGSKITRKMKPPAGGDPSAQIPVLDLQLAPGLGASG